VSTPTPADPRQFIPVPATAPDLITQLVEDTGHLADLLGRPPIRTSGASGVLNPDTVSVIRVWDPAVDLDALLEELTALPILPDLLVLRTVNLDARLRASRWHPGEEVVCVRHDQPVSLDRARPTGYSARALGRADLPAVRSLLDDCFDTDDSVEHLPDSVLDVPGLQLLAAVDRTGRLAATVGTRPTRTGALLFSLATARAHRGRGLAARLVAEARQSALRQGASHLSCDISFDLLPFYQGLGFRSHSHWQRYARQRDPAARAPRPPGPPRSGR
jgi:GNAT superfamily N-acetyltransferase